MGAEQLTERGNVGATLEDRFQFQSADVWTMQRIGLFTIKRTGRKARVVWQMLDWIGGWLTRCSFTHISDEEDEASGEEDGGASDGERQEET